MRLPFNMIVIGSYRLFPLQVSHPNRTQENFLYQQSDLAPILLGKPPCQPCVPEIGSAGGIP